jgi:hypothetical protein
MDGNRLFMVGVVLLLLGVQFRIVESFELNEMATQFVDKRFPSKAAESTSTYTAPVGYSDPWLVSTPTASGSKTRRFTHPQKLALSFISVGVILILVSPAYRK